MTADVEVLDDPASAAAERVAAARGHLALSGGSTPRAAYELAAARRSDWSNTTMWFTDERCVPPGHEDSNYRMVQLALLDRIDGAGPAVHRVEGERGPHEGADRYEADLRRAFGDRVPALDLFLLGLGADGHTCSLFPNDPALSERERLAVGVERAGTPPLVARVTLTLPVVNAGRSVVFLVTGEGKADAVARVVSGPPDPAVPASLVQPASGSLTVLLDPPAASGLEDGRR
jgi:6-phosphogluconolactonase